LEESCFVSLLSLLLIGTFQLPHSEIVSFFRTIFNMASLSDNEIVHLWQDPEFPGSFAGARSFQMFLKLEKNLDIPITKI